MMKGKQISLSYGQKKALREVSFHLEKGRITTFIGHSGAGKTTLLKCLANLQTNYEGTIELEGKELKTFSAKERASHVGFVLQQFHLFPHLTALENCVHPLLKIFGMKKEAAQEKAYSILKALGIESFADSYPNQLSGGQQQRVAIARALVLDPKILFFDEPSSALDPESKQCLATILLSLKDKGITMGLSSHDMPFIRKLLDKVYFMEQGSIVEAFDSSQEQLKNSTKIQKFLEDI